MMSPSADHWPARAVPRAFLLGILGLIAAGVGTLFTPTDFFRGYLLAFLFWAGISIGSLGLLLLHQLTGGDWGDALRKPLESATRNLPLVALAFVPVLLGVHSIYPWALPDSAIDASKRVYLNVPFFVVRSAVYFLIWIGLGYLLVTLRRRQDERFDPARASRLGGLGAGGMVLWVMSVTFASFDWMMSLEPEWFSTIYGMYVLSGFALAAMAFVVLTTASVMESDPEEPLAGSPSPGLLHDFGNLLFMLVFFYAYIAFSQFIIIWSGNLPEEMHWYVARRQGAWAVAPYVLAVGHFAIPFLILLSRTAKRSPRVLVTIALLLLVMRGLDLSWMVMPTFHPVTPGTWLMALAAWVGVGGIWFALFGRRLSVRRGGNALGDAA